MKGTFAIAVIAFCLLFPVNSATGNVNDLNFNSLSCPNCVYCNLTPEQVIEKAAAEAEVPLERALFDYNNNINTVTPVQCGWEVSIRTHAGFILIDIIDDF